MADKRAKVGARKPNPILDFHTKSERKEKSVLNLKQRWKRLFELLPVGCSSGFYLAYQVLRAKTKPDKTFKDTPRKLFCRTNQVLTGHAYTGEYYARMNIPDNPLHCRCNPEVFQTRDHLI